MGLWRSIAADLGEREIGSPRGRSLNMSVLFVKVWKCINYAFLIKYGWRIAAAFQQDEKRCLSSFQPVFVAFTVLPTFYTVSVSSTLDVHISVTSVASNYIVFPKTEWIWSSLTPPRYFCGNLNLKMWHHTHRVLWNRPEHLLTVYIHNADRIQI